MKKTLIFISFIFVFLSCCFTSFDFSTTELQPAGVQQLTTACTSVEKSDVNNDYYIVGATNLNLSQYLANLFSNICAVTQNSTYKKLNLYLVFTHWEMSSSSDLKISSVLKPRAP